MDTADIRPQQPEFIAQLSERWALLARAALELIDAHRRFEKVRQPGRECTRELAWRSLDLRHLFGPVRSEFLQHARKQFGEDDLEASFDGELLDDLTERGLLPKSGGVAVADLERSDVSLEEAWRILAERYGNGEGVAETLRERRKMIMETFRIHHSDTPEFRGSRLFFNLPVRDNFDLRQRLDRLTSDLVWLLNRTHLGSFDGARADFLKAIEQRRPTWGRGQCGPVRMAPHLEVRLFLGNFHALLSPEASTALLEFMASYAPETAPN